MGGWFFVPPIQGIGSKWLQPDCLAPKILDPRYWVATDAV